MNRCALLLGFVLCLASSPLSATMPPSPTADVGELLVPIPEAIASGNMSSLKMYLAEDVVVREKARNQTLTGRAAVSTFLERWDGSTASGVQVMLSRDEMLITFERLSPDYGRTDQPRIGYAWVFHCAENQITGIDVIERDARVEDIQRYLMQSKKNG